GHARPPRANETKRELGSADQPVGTNRVWATASDLPRQRARPPHHGDRECGGHDQDRAIGGPPRGRPLPLLVGVEVVPVGLAGDPCLHIRFSQIYRSLTAYQTVLGLGRDMGYLPFNGQEWWTFHPYMPVPLYYVVQGLLVITAYLAIRVSRSRHTIFLAACAV